MLFHGGCRKVVKRQIIKNNHIMYSDHRVGEEALFSFQVLLYANSIGFVESPVYNYCVRSNSLSQSSVLDPWSDVSLNIRNKCKKIGAYDKYADTINSFIIVSTMVCIANMAKTYRWKDFKKRSIKKYTWMQHNVDPNYKIDIRHMNKKAIPIWVLMKIRFRTLLFFLCKYR